MQVSSLAGCRQVVLLATVLGFAVRLPAQQALFAEYMGGAHLVRKIHHGWVTIEYGGKMVEFNPTHSALLEAEEYLPILVEVNEAQGGTSEAGSRRGLSFNNAYFFQADLTSPVDLSDVYFVIERKSEADGKIINFQEGIGELKAGLPRQVAVRVPLEGKLDRGSRRLHLFSSGRELFTTQQPPGYRETMLDKMVAKRISGVTKAAPMPFITAEPVYPALLRSSGSAGEATVEFRILPSGVVADPVVKTATAPAFGEAAVAAVKLWHFLPGVREGHAVETTVQLPLSFTPPKPSAGEHG